MLRVMGLRLKKAVTSYVNESKRWSRHLITDSKNLANAIKKTMHLLEDMLGCFESVLHQPVSTGGAWLEDFKH